MESMNGNEAYLAPKELIMHFPQQCNAVRIIQDEHERLSTVMNGMLHFVRRIDEGEKAPGLMVFRAMLYYIREYPEQVHHPKEDRFLFARLRERTSELDGTLAELEAQHAKGETLERELEHALARYELEGSAAFPAFRDLVEKYAKFYFNHMHLEEDVVLPAAQRLLTSDDWNVIDTAFAANRDPLAGAELKDNLDNLDKLYSLIVTIVPAAMGSRSTPSASSPG